MEILLGLLCVLGVIMVLGHALWVVLAWFLRLAMPVEAAPKAQPRELLWTCHGCGVTNPSPVGLCRNCRLERTSPLATELGELAVADRQLRELRKAAANDSAAFDKVLERLETRRKDVLGRQGARFLVIPSAQTPAVAGPSEPPAWQFLEQILAGCQDPRALKDDDRRQALARYGALVDGQWRRLTDRSLLALARFLESANEAGEAVKVYRALLDRCAHEQVFSEAALEAGCIAVQQEQWDQARAFLTRVEKNDPTPTTLHQARELLKLCQTHLPVPVQPPPVEPKVPPAPAVAAPPPPPRRSFTEVLAAFMEESNIVWGELLGGMLMVGCSIALVISLWKTLEQIQYFPFLIFAALTATLYGVGLYTLHHWKLESTSRGLLVIATLLVPLNLLVLARLSHSAPSGILELFAEATSLILFTWLVYRSSRVLVPAEAWALTLGVVGTAAMQLLVPRLLTLGVSAGPAFVVLSNLPVALHGVACTLFLRRLSGHGPLGRFEAKCLFTFLGLAVFSLAVTLGFFVHWSGEPLFALERLAVSVALAGVPVIVTGLLVQRQLADDVSAAWRTAAQGIALAGMVALTAAAVLAWPDPVALTLVCVLDCIILVAIAFRAQLPAAHTLALGCLVVAYLTVFHGLAGHLGGDREGLARRMLASALSAESGTALVALAMLLAAGAEALARTGRKAHGVYYAAGGATVASLSFLLLVAHWTHAPGRVAIVCAIYAAACLAANLRWREPLVARLGLALLVLASVWTVHWGWAVPLQVWALFLAIEALLLSVVASVVSPASGEEKTSLGVASRETALAVGIAALLLVPLCTAFPDAGWYPWIAMVEAATALLLARQFREPVLSWVGSVLVGVALLLEWNAALPLLPWFQVWLLALLTHATLMLASGLLASSFASRIAYAARVYATPLLKSALVSSGMTAVMLLPALRTGHADVMAAFALWLAVLWLVFSWTEASPVLFTLFQGMLSFAVVLAVCAGLERQDWFESYRTSLSDLRSFDAIATGLGALSLVWVSVRLALKTNAAARALLAPPWPTVDQGLLALLVLLQLAVAVGRLAAVVGAAHWLSPEQASATTGAWLLLGVVSAAWIAAMWEPWPPDTINGLLLLALAVPVLIAAGIGEPNSAEAALRWGLALCCLTCSVPYWQRTRLSAILSRLRCPAGVSPTAMTTSHLLLWLGTLGPVVVLTLATGFRGPLVVGLPDGSLFARMGWAGNYLSPLLLLALVLAGHAVRERGAGFAFCAGLMCNLAASLLVWHLHRGMPPANWWVPILQVNAFLFGCGALAWLALSTRDARAENSVDADALLDVQLAGSTLCTAVVLLFSLILLLLAPTGPFPAVLKQAGSWGGCLALIAWAAAAVWHGRRHAPSRTGRTCVGAGLFFGILAACFANAWDSGTGLSYHVLTACWIAVGGGVIVAGLWVPGVADLLPRRDARRAIFWIGVLILGLAWLGTYTDPGWQTWSVAGTVTVVALYAVLAVWSEGPGYVYLSGLLVNAVGILLWQSDVLDKLGYLPSPPWGPGMLDQMLAVHVICFALASAAWTACELGLRARTPPIDLRGRFAPYSHVAAVVGLSLLTILVGIGIAGDVAQEAIHLASPLLWIAVVATVAAMVVKAWDPDAGFAAAALHACGLVVLGLLIHGAGLSPRGVGWMAAWMLAAYALLTSAAAWLNPRHTRLRWSLHLPDSAMNWSEASFLFTQGTVATLAGALGLWTVLTFPTLAERSTGALAVLAIVPAGVLLTGAVSGRWGEGLRHLTLLLGVFAVAVAGWSVLDPLGPAPWLNRSAFLLAALAVFTVALPLTLPSPPGGEGWVRGGGWLSNQPAWAEAARALAPILGALTLASVFLVMVLELLSYNADAMVRRTPMAGWAIALVAVTLAAMIAAGIRLAVSEKSDPLGLSPRARTAYVYLSEILLVLLIGHLKLNVPEIFPRVGRYWPLAAMAVAYLGAGLSMVFRRKGLEVLATPLQNTGVFLPLLPLLAFWAKPPVALQQFAATQAPGMVPWLNYLVKLPQYFQDHAAVWFLIGLLYAGVAVANRSFRFAVAAALAANFGLWALWHHHGLAFLVHPQLWLIPVSLILLGVEHLQRDRLDEYQRLSLRYFALLLLYVSSTADMFIAGLGNSMMLPLVLAVLSVLGVLTGILLQVRAFLFTGFGFLFLVVFSMIWHAAVDRYQTWVWWASGVVLGAMILALFAVFEKRRNDILKVIEQVKAWE